MRCPIYLGIDFLIDEFTLALNIDLAQLKQWLLMVINGYRKWTSSH